MSNKRMHDRAGNETGYQDLDSRDMALVEKLTRQGSSRRQAMKLMMATGVSIAAASNILLGGREAVAATPKKGGTLRFASDFH